MIEDGDGLELESYDGKLKIKVAGKSFRLDTDGDEGSSARSYLSKYSAPQIAFLSGR